MIIAFAVLLCLPAGTGAPSTPNQPAVLLDNDPFRAAGPYCGVYSVFGCVKLFGKSTPIATLFEPRYVGSRAGSTLAELIRAVEDCGLRSRALRGLTAESLKAADAPIILHAKDRRRGQAYDHWLLYLGEQNGKARVLDPPGSVELVPFAQLLARWDGTGLIVSDRAIETTRYVKATWLGTLATLCLPVAFTAMVLGLFKPRAKVVSQPKRLSTLRRIGRDTLALVGCSFLLATGNHVFSSEGFFRNRAAIASVQTRFYTENMPEYSVEEMARVVQDPKTVVIDARYARDYQLGHLPGAINVPVNSTISYRTQVLGNLPKDQPIVLYCQSEGCHFDEELADFLHFNGYSNLKLFTGGYRAWEERAKPTKP